MYEHHRQTLPNGVTVVTIEAPGLHSSMLATYVRCGSRHETAATNGVSHFLEHLFFRGCERYPDGRAMNALVEDVGGNLNGITARDHGYYYTPLHPSGLATGMDIVGSMLAKPLLKEIDIEREVILEEILDEVDDEGRDIDIDNLSKTTIWGRHPLAMKIGGTPENVKRLTKRTLAAHHAKQYVAENLIVAVAGPVKHRKVLELAGEHFGAFPKGVRTKDTPPPAWPEGPTFQFVRHDESQSEIRLCFPAFVETHPLHAALLVLRRVLDDGLSSRLQQRLVDRKGLAYSVGAGLDLYADTGTFDLDVACAHRKVADTLSETLELLGELTVTPPSEEELERARRRHRMGFDFSQDNPSDLVGWFGGTEVFHPPESFEVRARKIDAVTSAEVLAAANTLFRKPNLHVTVVGGLDRAARARVARIVAESKALPGSAR